MAPFLLWYEIGWRQLRGENDSLIHDDMWRIYVRAANVWRESEATSLFARHTEWDALETRTMALGAKNQPTLTLADATSIANLYESSDFQLMFLFCINFIFCLQSCNQIDWSSQPPRFKLISMASWLFSDKVSSSTWDLLEWASMNIVIN